MTWQITLFLILPVIAASLAGWYLRHWALAAAAACGAGAVFFALPTFGILAARPFMPLLSGMAVAGSTLAVALAIRPEISRWTAMSIATATAFGAHFLYLQYAMAGR